jgi:hypothetical protein
MEYPMKEEKAVTDLTGSTGGVREAGTVRYRTLARSTGTQKRAGVRLADNLKHPTKGLIAVYLAAGWSVSRIADSLNLTYGHVREVANLPSCKARIDELHTRLLLDLAREEMDK